MTYVGPSAPPFERDEYLDIPGIVGARWWNRELKDQERQASRRAALLAIGVGLTGTAVVGSVIAAIEGDSPSFERKPSLEVQRRFGWSFGAYGEPLTFDGRRVLPFDPAKLQTLREDCVGTQLAPFQHAAIFDAVFHVPRERPTEERRVFTGLDSYLLPVVTGSMGSSYRLGEALSRVLSAMSRRVAVIVDLSGPDAVAVAAGLSETHAPVWVLDHWPHPRGVVPAHMTLASAIFFQPRFAATQRSRPTDAPPVFIVDRARLNAYVDASDRFDNRYLPRLPASDRLEALSNVRDVLYVPPADSWPLDPYDLNETLVSYRTRGLSVRAITARAFAQDVTEAPALSDDPIESLLQPGKLYYRGSRAQEAAFAQHYSGASPPMIEAHESSDHHAFQWRPVALRNAAQLAGVSRVGTVEVVALGAAILGARFDRNGSWNRVSSSGSWGG